MRTSKASSAADESTISAIDVDDAEPGRPEPEPDQSDLARAVHDEPTAAGRVPAGGRNRRRFPLITVTALLGVLVLVAAGLAIYFGMRVSDDNDVRSAQSQATDAARSFALTMVSYDAAGMDSYVQKVMAGSTGELKDTFTRTSNGLKDTLAKAGVKSTGRVLDMATKAATTTHVELVAVVQQTASNATVTTPQEAVNVLVMSMERVDGRWLASSVKNPVGATP